MKLINLCPHPVILYPGDAPDTVTMGEYQPLRIILPDGPPARIVTNVMELATQGAVPTYEVVYCPLRMTGMRAPADGVEYIVSLPVALALPERGDLLVPFREVRNRSGTVVGCRALSRARIESFTVAT